MHPSYGRKRNEKATSYLVNKNRHLSSVITAVVFSYSRLCALFSAPPTTLETASDFLFTLCPKSPQPTFPLKPSYTCQIWPTVFAPFHGQIVVLLLVSYLE